MSDCKEREDDYDYRDIPLDVPLRSAKEYRERKRKEDDILLLCGQRSVFNKEYGQFLKSLEPMPEEPKNEVPPFLYNSDYVDHHLNFLPWPNLNTSLNPILNPGSWLEYWPAINIRRGIITPKKKDRVQLPADIMEKKRASYLSNLCLTAKSPLLQGWFATLTADLYWKILGYLTGVEPVHTKALWISMRSDLTRFDTIPKTKSRSEVFFLERLSNNLFEQFDNRGKRMEKRRKLPTSLREFQIEYMKEVKKKRISKEQRIQDNNSIIEEKSDIIIHDTSPSYNGKLTSDGFADCKAWEGDKDARIKDITMEDQEMDGSIMCIFVHDEFFSQHKGELMGNRDGNVDEKCGYERARVCGFSLDTCLFYGGFRYVRNTGNHNDVLSGVLLKYRDKQTVDWTLRWFEKMTDSIPLASGSLCRIVVKAETLGNRRIVEEAYLYHHIVTDFSPRNFGHDWHRDNVWAQGRLSKIANILKSPECKNVVVALGAGTSISRRIFDRKKRLYERLMRVDLENYRKSPRRTLRILRMICSGQCTPSTADRFLQALQRHGKLLRVYTTNIDGSQEEAGVDPDTVIQTHGNLKAAHCTNEKCKAPYDIARFKRALFDEYPKEVPSCEQCGSFVKPSIWMAGEPLLKGQNLVFDLMEADLVIVAGAPMSVYPYNIIPIKARNGCPCLMINCEPSGIMQVLRNMTGTSLQIDIGMGSPVRLSQNRQGTVRFIGNIPGKAPGLWYGVELSHGGGKNHGSFRGKQYFRCSEGKGVFVQLPQLKLDRSRRHPSRQQTGLNDTRTGMDLRSIDTYYAMGDCDDGFRDLARLCGWKLEL